MFYTYLYIKKKEKKKIKEFINTNLKLNRTTRK